MARQQAVDHVDVLLKRLKANRTPGFSYKEIEDAERTHKDNMQLLTYYEAEHAKYKAERDTNNKHKVKDRDAPTALEKANRKIVSLDNENSDLKQRLSKITGQKMSENNSNIADLSDPYRPTNLAEKFREVYDNQWTCAYEELEKLGQPEPRIVELLAKLIKISDEFCSDVAKQQLEKLLSNPLHDVVNPTFKDKKGAEYAARQQSPYDISNDDRKNAERQMKEFRKSMCHLSVKSLKSIFGLSEFKNVQQEYRILDKSPSVLNDFVEISIELLWRMKVQEAPMCLVWQSPGEPFTREKFSEYTRKGSRVVQTVWPAVLLHVDGPLMCKGIVDVK